MTLSVSSKYNVKKNLRVGRQTASGFFSKFCLPLQELIALKVGGIFLANLRGLLRKQASGFGDVKSQRQRSRWEDRQSKPDGLCVWVESRIWDF